MFAQLKEKKLMEKRIVQEQNRQYHNSQTKQKIVSTNIRQERNMLDSATIISNSRIKQDNHKSNYYDNKNDYYQKFQENSSPINSQISKKKNQQRNSDLTTKNNLKMTGNKSQSKSPNSHHRNMQLNQTIKPCKNQVYLCDEQVMPIIKKQTLISEDDLLEIEQFKRMQKNIHIYPYYLQQHLALNIKARSILLDWMMQLSNFYHIHRQTYYIAVNIVDSYLSAISNLPLRYFQLVGITSLFLSMKLQQYEFQNPNQLSNATNKAFTEDDILKMQGLILKTLKYKIRTLTHSFWMNQFLQKWLTFDSHNCNKNIKDRSKLYRMSYLILDVIHLNIQSLIFKSRTLSASILLLIISLLSESIDISEIQHSLPFTSKYLVQSTIPIIVQYKKFLTSVFDMKIIELLESIQFVSSYFFVLDNYQSQQFCLQQQGFNNNNLMILEAREQFMNQANSNPYY